MQLQAMSLLLTLYVKCQLFTLTRTHWSLICLSEESHTLTPVTIALWKVYSDFFLCFSVFKLTAPV